MCLFYLIILILNFYIKGGPLLFFFVHEWTPFVFICRCLCLACLSCSVFFLLTSMLGSCSCYHSAHSQAPCSPYYYFFFIVTSSLPPCTNQARPSNSVDQFTLTLTYCERCVCVCVNLSGCVVCMCAASWWGQKPVWLWMIVCQCVHNIKQRDFIPLFVILFQSFIFLSDQKEATLLTLINERTLLVRCYKLKHSWLNHEAKRSFE